MKLDIKNIGKVLENDITFNWIKVAPLPDRYQFHIESNTTQTIYYLELYRFDELNGLYRLMITNSKYRNADNKKWIAVKDIKDITLFKRICIDFIRSVNSNEIPF
jgi:hypothetical protein